MLPHPISSGKNKCTLYTFCPGEFCRLLYEVGAIEDTSIQMKEDENIFAV
jgi:hypothetical protein